ncbi:MAG: hypothetical protein Q8L37_05155 [Candidatus Gottesmanbacteria bacterium]|nr:hypothetical protein [Candidatus Gottesmanbacteria bacterium]
MIALLFITELILLYLLSRKLIQSVFTVLFYLTRSRTIGIWIVTIIFFPGTVVHELAHLFTAEILGVHTGKLTLIPESLEGTEIKAGGVMIAETDPLRRTLIGLAPVYIGILVLSVIAYFARHALAGTQEHVLRGWLPLTLIFYLLFSVSNSMFSSKEDMKGVLPFAVTAAIFLIAGYFAGLRIGLTGQLLTGLNLVIQTLVQSLGIVLGINIIVLFITTTLLKVTNNRFRL